MAFLTLEDINTTIYSNQGFHWYEIDLTKLATGSEDFDWIKIDFCEIKRQKLLGADLWEISVKVNSSNWTNGVTFILPNGELTTPYSFEKTANGFTAQLTLTKLDCKILLYMGNFPVSENLTVFTYKLASDKLVLKFEELNTSQTICVNPNTYNTCRYTVEQLLTRGYNLIEYDNNPVGYLLVDLKKSDFQFNCTQTLTNGKVNTVLLGVDSDYKPSGAMVGDYTPYITVLYGDETLPVTWNSQLNDYTFDIDLTNREKETDIPLTIYVEVNEVLNQTETEIRLHTRFETINDLTKVNTLFTNGGIGRLGADITLTSDLTVNKDIYLIGNDYTIDLDGHKIIVPSDKTFKASNTNFRNGVNTIQQNTGSKVGLTDCTFGYCTGLGSVIDCQVDLDSLENPTDFTTNLTRCIIGECETAILHGGELTVTDCKVQGIISDPAYPYFLYQTDGNATLLQNEFTLINNTQISSDIEFNSCIFICGETAQVNGYSHQELQNNNIQQFLETQRNSSTINVTYLYTPISDYITLYSEKGYCHSVSNVDYVFKTNVTPTRSD